MDTLRTLIRDILAEELERIGSNAAPRPQSTRESVKIGSSADLNAFAARILEMAQDGRKRADILAGRHLFRLAQSDTIPLMAHQPLAPVTAPPAQARFDSGMVCERDIALLPEGTRTIRIANSVRLTPLARDELSRKGIKVERTPS